MMAIFAFAVNAVSKYLNLVSEEGELIAGGLQFRVGGVQGAPLRLNNDIHVIEFDDVYHPSAQPCRGRRLGHNKLRIELWVLYVRLHSL